MKAPVHHVFGFPQDSSSGLDEPSHRRKVRSPSIVRSQSESRALCNCGEGPLCSCITVMHNFFTCQLRMAAYWSHKIPFTSTRTAVGGYGFEQFDEPSRPYHYSPSSYTTRNASYLHNMQARPADSSATAAYRDTAGLERDIEAVRGYLSCGRLC